MGDRKRTPAPRSEMPAAAPRSSRAGRGGPRPSARPRLPSPAGAPATKRGRPTTISSATRASLHALRKLVAPADLSVVFQPIVSFPDGTLYAYEALVRCALPAYRSPPALFEDAVKHRCSGRLGREIREIGVPLASGVPLFVNIHPHELSEGWLVRPDDPIYSHDHDVFLEVTESVPMTHYDLCMKVLKEVCSRGGVYLVIDDLGAGYSNLKRIADLEPRVVKLDRELIAGLDSSPRQQELVESVISLCGRLGAKVVAEGIETPEEATAAIRAGAHYGQGYLFGRPSFPPSSIYWPEFPSPGPPARPSPPPRSRDPHFV